ncbi:MAG: isochorismatase [Marinitoga sp. 4572_148]|nr:MAG: isochorismatase [Marinitoga sp. 4572_148]
MKKIIEKLKNAGINPENSAILCVDCQNGFTLRCPDELPVNGTDEKWIESVNEFLLEAKNNNYLIVASKDDHPENHVSFDIWPPHCIKGTYGKKLAILGLAGDVCVLETIKTALERGFDIIVLEDFIKSVNGKSMKEILKLENLSSKVKFI